VITKGSNVMRIIPLIILSDQEHLRG
jgi:hypothetical protein